MTRPAMRPGTILALLAVTAAAVVGFAPFAGPQLVPPGAVWGAERDAALAEVFWRLRVPRVCLAFLAGAALAVSGMTFQAMFRNPLATPFTLGVSGGAAFGTALYVRLGLRLAIPGLSGTSVFAFLGALLAVAAVYGLTRLRRGVSTTSMLLAGVAISFFFASLILFLQYLSDFAQSVRILRWLMGGLEPFGFREVLHLLPFVAAGTFVLFVLTHELNLLATGDDLAASRGVAVNTVKTALFIVTSLMVGGVVAFCGPIGFVGMMAPHICRLLVGANHRVLMPAAFLFGGLFLTACDTLARTLISPAEIPVGIITALLGGPFFLWLLFNRSPAEAGFAGD